MAPAATTESISVVVVEGHLLLRQGLVQILAMEDGMRVVGECGFGNQAITVVGRTKPDIVLLDSDRAGTQALGMLRRLLLVSPVSKVVVVTVYDEPQLVGDLMTAGAHAYLLKNSSREYLISALRKVHRDSGHVVLSVSRETLQQLNRDRAKPVLSKREREVINLVAGGLRNSEIAGALYISEGTVKRHLANAYNKLGTTSRISAVKKAILMGMVSSDALLGSSEETALE